MFCINFGSVCRLKGGGFSEDLYESPLPSGIGVTASERWKIAMPKSVACA